MSDHESSRRASVWRIVRRTIQAWFHDDAIRWSAAIAYYSVASQAPLAVLGATVVGTVMEDEAAAAWGLEQVDTLGGPPGGRSGGNGAPRDAAAGPEPVGALLTMGLLAFGATAVFSNLQRALNRVWDVDARRGQCSVCSGP